MFVAWLVITVLLGLFLLCLLAFAEDFLDRLKDRRQQRARADFLRELARRVSFVQPDELHKE